MLDGWLLRKVTTYHIAFDVSSGDAGEAQGNTRGAVERAAEQVLVGLNGMIEFMSNNKLLVNLREKRLFILIIFTTAKLFTTDADLSSASLENGEFEQGSIKVEPSDGFGCIIISRLH